VIKPFDELKIKGSMKNNNNTYEDKENGLDKLAPNLDKLKKGNPFTVPENYFNQLSRDIKDKIAHEDELSLSDRIRVWVMQPKYSVSLAAVVVLLVMVFSGVFKQQDDSFEDFSGITLEQLFEENPEIIEYMDEALLIEVLYATSEETESLETTDGLSLDTNITDDAVIDFLIDEDISTESLYNL